MITIIYKGNEHTITNGNTYKILTTGYSVHFDGVEKKAFGSLSLVFLLQSMVLFFVSGLRFTVLVIRRLIFVAEGPYRLTNVYYLYC